MVLFGTDFEPAGFTLRILSILIIVFTLATVFGHVPLVIYGKENVILVATIIGAVTNFSINSLLIPHYMNNGAAIASVVSEVLVTAILMYGSTRVMRIHILNNDIAAIAHSNRRNDHCHWTVEANSSQRFNVPAPLCDCWCAGVFHNNNLDG